MGGDGKVRKGGNARIVEEVGENKRRGTNVDSREVNEEEETNCAT